MSEKKVSVIKIEDIIDRDDAEAMQSHLSENTTYEAMCARSDVEGMLTETQNKFDNIEETIKVSLNISNFKPLNKEDFLKQISGIHKLLSETNFDDIDHDIMRLIEDIRVQADRLIKRDEFGRMLEPLELEVALLVEEGKQRIADRKRLGDRYIEPKRIAGYKPYKKGEWHGEPHDPERDVWPNTIEYLEMVFGKYLKVFNKDKDYLYLNDLEKIIPRFGMSVGNHAEKTYKKPRDYYIKLDGERNLKRAIWYEKSKAFKRESSSVSKHRRTMNKL